MSLEFHCSQSSLGRQHNKMMAYLQVHTRGNWPGEVAALLTSAAVKVGDNPLRDRGELFGVDRGEVGWVYTTPLEQFIIIYVQLHYTNHILLHCYSYPTSLARNFADTENSHTSTGFWTKQKYPKDVCMCNDQQIFFVSLMMCFTETRLTT